VSVPVKAVSVKALPADERPRERLLKLGPEKLTDAELLAILLGTGIKGQSVIELARELLHHCKEKHPEDPGLRSLLLLREHDYPGLGMAKKCLVLAAIHLGMRAAREKFPEQVDLNNPRAVYEYLSRYTLDSKREQFMVVLLNAKNRLIDVECISEGTLTASLVHPREVFKSAIRRSAHAMILAHNHPSGDPSPSREDREVTRQLVQAGKLLRIEVLDHLVVADNRYFSFRERGLMECS
jgi:DNA repair protein RadC